jgi:PIN domain nuclease of toxin-antitoxin system
LRLLLDTHVWLWLVADTAKLPARYSAAIGDAGNTLIVSVASVWELSIKQRTGKLATSLSLDDIVRALEGVEWLPVGLEHVRRVHDLPLIHRDPFDRILVAQTFVEGLTLLTVDHMIQQYGVPILPLA